ncbi:MAG: hypothetical protein K0R61_2374 [Microvirga sp.]|jgi:hypothetical protein|nr:hypothetical protein [Microvirga sp.]MDF2971924.1 hypothetical protein [Microvirga sp.]
MPTSLREQALAAFEARLLTLTGAGLIDRNITYEVATAEMPAIIQFDGSDRNLKLQSGRADIETDVSVLVMARATLGTDIGPAVNDWAAKVRAVIGSYRTLGGLPGVEDIEWRGSNGPILVGEEDAPPFASMIVQFSIMRFESEGDPYALPWV